jgi:hypothetical protein
MSRRCGGSARKSTRAWFRFRRRIRRVGSACRPLEKPHRRPPDRAIPSRTPTCARSPESERACGSQSRCCILRGRRPVCLGVDSCDEREFEYANAAGGSHWLECKPTDRGKSATAIHCGDALLVARALGVFENNLVRALERGQTCGRGIGSRGARRMVERGRNAFLALVWTSVDESP